MTLARAAVSRASPGLAYHHILLLLAINLVWGLNFVVARLGVQEFPPVFFTAIRFFALFVLFAPMLRWHKGQMTNIFWIAMGSGAGHFVFMYLGIAGVSTVASAAIAIQLGPAFATILSVVFLGERIGLTRTASLGLAFGGVILMGFTPEIIDDIGPILLCVMASFCWAFSTLFQRLIRDVGVFELQGWIALLSWPVLLGMSFALEDGQIASLSTASWVGWGAIIYNVIGASILGHGGIFYLLQRYEVTTITPYTLLAPVFGAIFGVLLLGHLLTGQMAMGGLITLIGVMIIALRQRKTKGQRTAKVRAKP